MEYFVFNKASDYARGYCEHADYSSDGILTEPGYYGRAAFFSRILDSTREGTVWHRLLCSKGSGRGVVYISFYTAEQTEGVSLTEEGDDIRTVIHNPELSVEQKKELLRPFLREQQRLRPDLLLHRLSGRYLWFLLEIYPQTEEPVLLGNFRIQFPAESWTRYLPELYRKEMGQDCFLDRFLAVFQSIYEDIGEYIQQIPEKLDPVLAPPELLSQIADWMDVEEPYMWTEEKLRYLLEHLSEFYQARGTRRGIELFVELYTGEKPFVVEWQDWEQFRDKPGRGVLLKTLYEDDPGSLLVMVREECIPAFQDYQTLLRMLERQKPVQLTLKLIVLKPYIFVDGYSYLGVNSVLGHYREAELDGSSRLAFATVAERQERSEL